MSKVKETKTVEKKSVKKTPAPKKASVIKKKAVIKKPTVKKQELKRALDSNAFDVLHGGRLYTLLDLRNELDSMLEYQYLFHRETGNHFSEWAMSVLEDEKAAKGLSKAWTRKDAKKFLVAHLKGFDLN